MGLVSSIRKHYGAAERRAGWLLAVGLAAAALWNLRQWRRDRRRLAQVAGQEPETYDLDGTAPVSILLPAWNEEGNLGPCIESILGLRYPDLELVVCAGGGDATLELARRCESPGVIVLEQRPGEGKQGALRRCYARSTGAVIFLTDADCILDDECFEATLGPVVADGEDAATGAWRPLDRQTDHPFVQYQWAHHVYREVWMGAYAPTLDGRNAVVRQAALEAVGAFEIEAPIGTDYVLSKQLTSAGYRIRFARGSRVQTEYPETIRAYWRQQWRWFRNPLVHEARWLASPVARSHVWAGLAATFLLSAALPALVGGLFRSVWTSSVLHLLLAQLRTHAVLQRSAGALGIQLRPLRACAFLPLGWASLAGGFWSLLCRPRKRRQW